MSWPNDKGQNDKQYHGQMKKDRMTNNEIQNTTQKTNDLATLTP